MPHKPLPPTPRPGDHAEELLVILAHELRRPLTTLLGALATLQHRQQALSTIQQLLGTARRQGEQLGRPLEQVLAAASVDRAPARAGPRSVVDGAAVAAEAGYAARLAHPRHRITIEVAGPLLVRVDPLAVGRILGNLLDNAAAYSPPGTPIRLSARRDGGHALLAVQDHGPGIPPDQRDRIFSPTRACTIRPPRLAVGLAWPVHRSAAGLRQPRPAAAQPPASAAGCPV